MHSGAVALDFADRLALVLKALAVSRSQLAAALAVDKSLVSRWLSGGTVPGNHNLSRLTAFFAVHVPGFTMFDWEGDFTSLAARLGIAPTHTGSRNRADVGAVSKHVPDFARLPAFSSSAHETAARGPRYCGMWRSWMPTVGRPNDFHCEHTVIWQDGQWLSGFALGFSYRWPLAGFIANGQLTILLSDEFDFVTRTFSRADQPIIDQVDGLMLAAASLPHQAPTACRVIMERVTAATVTRDEMDAALVAHSGERRLFAADQIDPVMRADLLPDCGPSHVQHGGDRLLRADTAMRLVKTRSH